MAGKYFLVYKGLVSYYPNKGYIVCYSLQECFIIELDPTTEVNTRGARKIYGAPGEVWCYHGNEIWANGERYWVRLKAEA
jgi:hypothetical protein